MKLLEAFLSELRQKEVTLWLDEERLRYRAPEGVMTPELVAELKSRKPEILKFLKQVNQTVQTQRPPLTPRNHSNPVPLSFAQQRFWLLHQFEPQSSANNMPVVLRLTGKLDLAVLEKSVNEIVRRHEILRTTYPVIDGHPYQQIAPELSISIPTIDLRHLPNSDEVAFQLATEAAQQPFNLAEGPMLRVKLFQLQNQEYLFLWCFHCITGDGSSSDIFYQELTTLYAAFSQDQPSPLPELAVQYRDFSEWQREWLQGEVLEKQLQYWKQQLSGNLAAIQLPTDHPRPPAQTYRGDRCPRMLSKSLHESLLKLSQNCGATLFMILLAAFETLLYRYSEQEDILINFTNAGRNQVETENLIGFFSGNLLLRTNFSGNPTFRELLYQVREAALEAYAHQDLPFEKLVEELRPEQNQSRSPLFQIKFALNPPWTNGRGMSSVELPDLSIESLFGYIYHGKTKFDLILVMREQAQGLGAVFDYNADLFDTETANRMMDHFQILLEAIAQNPDQPILSLPLLTPSESQQQLVDRPQTNYPQISIPQAFKIQVDQTPNAIALRSQDGTLTYRELDDDSTRLASYLKAIGIQPADKVGLCLPRSTKAIIAMLATLKVGGIYVALDPSDSVESRSHLLDQTQVKVLLTQGQSLPTTAKIINLNNNLDLIQSESLATTPLAPDEIACIQFDSVTLQAFGVTHRNLVNLAIAQDFSPTPEDILLQHSSPNQSTFEIWSSLLKGATLVIANQSSTLETLAELVEREQITTLVLPTRWLHQLVDLDISKLQSVRQIFTGNGVLSASQSQTLLKMRSNCKLTQIYQCSGTPGFTCVYPMTKLEEIETTIPIGHPIANTQLYVLNSTLQPAPIGVVGEIYVGGHSLAQKCGNSTAQFIANPFGSEIAPVLYQTGDLARYLPNGNLELIGRSDAIVKIRDWRIELRRVETLLSQHPAIQEVVVLADPNLPNDDSIVAYLVPRPDQLIKPADLRNYLRQQLPLLMVPSHFVWLDSIPLTATGQVDRTQLPPPTSQSLQVPQHNGNQLERELIEIWCRLFNLDSIDPQDNFFDLGGDSLLAVRLFSQIEQVFAKKLPLSVLIQAPTIEQLALLLNQEETEETWSPLVMIQSGSDEKLPLFCVHGAGFNVLIYRALALNLDQDQPVYGLQARGLGGKVNVSDRIEAVAADYIKEIQKIQPQGPYCLSGLSNGGNIALEMAQQLQSQGQEVAVLALFDTYGPNSTTLMPSVPRFFSSLLYLLQYSLPQFVQKLRHQNPTLLLKLLSQRSQRTPDPNSQAIDKLRRSQHAPEEHSSSQNPLYAWLDRFSQYVIDHSSWSFLPSALLKDVSGTVTDTLQELDQLYSQAQKAYTLKPYSGQIDLFRAVESPPGFRVDPQMGWGAIAKQGVTVHRIPGNHTSIMTSTVLAQYLTNQLYQANQQRAAQTLKRASIATPASSNR